MAEEKQVFSGDVAAPVQQTGVKHPGEVKPK
jgi:hypothetical protein